MNNLKISDDLSTNLMEEVYAIADLMESADFCELVMRNDRHQENYAEKLAEVKRLVGLMADPSIFTHGGPEKNHTNAIILAAANGLAECLRELLASPLAEIDIFDCDDDTALMIAAKCGELECLGILVAAGADVNLCDKRGDNALMSAMRRSVFDWSCCGSCAILAPLTNLEGLAIGSDNLIEVSRGEPVSVHPEVHALIAALIEAKSLALDLPENGLLLRIRARL